MAGMYSAGPLSYRLQWTAGPRLALATAGSEWEHIQFVRLQASSLAKTAIQAAGILASQGGCVEGRSASISQTLLETLGSLSRRQRNRPNFFIL